MTKAPSNYSWGHHDRSPATGRQKGANMDQVKIGKFIANERKGKGMTQKQLADEIGVSDKTISKWETGNGMPEISSVMPLCQILQINVNELLSGEHLSDDSYSGKAEENMMNLIHETEKNKSNPVLKIGIVLLNILAAVILYVFITVGMWLSPISFLDTPTLIIILLVAVLFLSVTKQWRPFVQTVPIIFGRTKNYTSKEVANAGIAVKLVGNSMLVCGVLITLQGLIQVGYDFDPAHLEPLAAAAAVSLIGIFYGCIFYLLLLPVRSKLELIRQKLEESQS